MIKNYFDLPKYNERNEKISEQNEKMILGKRVKMYQ